MKNIDDSRFVMCKYLIIALLIFYCSCKKHNLIEKSSQWDMIKYKEYSIENNTWNIQAVKSEWSETIFCDTLSGLMGWKWDFSGEKDMKNSNEVKTFPEIIFGKKPYSNYQSTTSRLPEKITKVEIGLKYEYILEAQGIYNISTDITFCDSTNPSEKNIRAKIMIWFDNSNMTFYESEKLKTAKISGHQYKIYIDTTHIGPEGKWNYIALLPDNLPTKGEINFKEYFDYFLSEGVLKPEWYLSSIELGSEISSGKGKILFKKFEVY
jgi:hypothetical protein